jgi:uncharacterized membrane protein (DUF106 family)
MSIFLLLKAVLEGMGLWKGLKTFIENEEVESLKNHLNKLDEAIDKARDSNSEEEIYEAQKSITDNVD